MKELFRETVGPLLVAVVLGLGVLWVVTGNQFFLYQYFAPKIESVRRQVFEGTKSYNQGMIQELQNMQFDYQRVTDPNAKAALAKIILHRAADYDEDRLPVDLRQFIRSLKEIR